jgi:hypothetical protein
VDRRLAEVEESAAEGTLVLPEKKAKPVIKRPKGDGGTPSVMAKTATKRREYSTRKEPCGSCGDPLFVCPSTIRQSLRCCGECTHYTEHTHQWELGHPDHVSPPTTDEEGEV